MLSGHSISCVSLIYLLSFLVLLYAYAHMCVVHVYMNVCMSVGTCVHGRAHMHRQAYAHVITSPTHSSSSMLRESLLLNSEFAYFWLVWLDRLLQGSSVSTSPRWDYRQGQHAHLTFIYVLGSKPWPSCFVPSCLYKHFTHWASSVALALFFSKGLVRSSSSSSSFLTGFLCVV